MQRHRHENLRLLQQSRAGTLHMPGQRDRNLNPAAVLERHDDAAGLLVVTKGGAGLPPSRRRRFAAGARHVSPALPGAGERNAAADAARLGDEAGAAEAINAEPPWRRAR